MEENNILVIVDDVWKKFELERVGISFGKDHKGCKIFVTSRDQNVLNNMGVNKIFQVGILLEDEAMNLFSKIVGEHDFQALATEIVKECGGLPIAITTVASALNSRMKNSRESSLHQVWKNALYELRKSDPVNIDGMDEKVYSSIKLSYDFLQSKEAKKLLLLCSLFEEDAEIPVKVLCNYGIGLNLFEGTSKLEVATNKTITLVETLKDHSLLLSGSREGFVRLHDVIRDVVISIASKDDEAPMYSFRDAVELDNFLFTEKFKKSTAISLYHIKADGYPETLRSPKLKLLRLINGSPNEVKFQHHFFEGLDQLFVLDLERVSLEPSPSPASSFCLLQNLQTLRLIDCDLGDISWIGGLNNLKILDLSLSYITELPKEIGKLNRMLSLNLHWCGCLQVIRPNVISRLTRLEELNLEGAVNGDDERPNASLDEVKNLPQLTNLSLAVPDVNMLPNNMFSDKLDKFNIRIGTVYSQFFFSRMLRLKLCPDSKLKEHDFEVLLKRSECLNLTGLKSAKNVAYELDSMGFPQLEQLTIQDSTEILCILNSNGNTDNRAAFGKLRDLRVCTCNKMKSLFPIYNIPKQLESITVRDCAMMEEIISDGREGDGDQLTISELRVLKLVQLPKIVQFKATRKSDEIRDEAQSGDDSVVPLFNGEVLFKLEELTLERLNVGKIWNGDQLRSPEFGFKSLTRVIMWKCDQLKGLLPSSVARSLVHLKDLKIHDCKGMEEVVFMEESTEEAKTFENISFPKLETLELHYLPNLKRFYAGDYINIDCPSLLELQIRNCPDLMEFSTNTTPTTENFEDLSGQVDKVLFNRKVVLNRLELVCLNIEKIWNGDQLRSSECGFKSLTCLVMHECDQLKGVIPSSVARSLVHLEVLRIYDCKAMKEVVFVEESTQEAKTFQNISFHKLETLELHNLPNLERFYAGDYINIDCPSLLELKIYNCPNFMEFPTNTTPTIKNENFEDLLDQVDKQLLFNHKVLFPKLKELTLDRLNFEKFWSGDQIRPAEFGFESLTIKKFDRQSLAQLKNLTVKKCDQLKGLLPSSVARSLVHLEDLRICDCKAMEEVVLIEEFTQEAFENIPFPKLKSLILSDLPNLKRFYAWDCVVEEHSDTGTLFHQSTAKILSQLRKLSIFRCPNLRQVIANDNKEAHDVIDEMADDIVFGQLETLILGDLSSLEIFYSGDGVLKFPRLKNLVVDGCLGMKTFSNGNLEYCSMLNKIVGRNNWKFGIFFDYVCYEGERDNFANSDLWTHRWEGDINTTVQRLWKDHNDLPFREENMEDSEEKD